MGNKLSRKKKISAGATQEDIDAFIRNVRPLDLLVFRGTEVFSKTIRILEHLQDGSGEVSHVEVAINKEWCTKIGPIKIPGIVDTPTNMLSWGSTASGPLNDGAMNAETNKSKFGVQIRVLSDLVKSYLTSPGANIGVCRLLDNPTAQLPREPLGAFTIRKAELVAKIDHVYDTCNGRTYDANPLSLLAAMFPHLRGINNASAPITTKLLGMNKWLFCSEFAAIIYIETGVIIDETDGVKDGKTLDPAHVLPVDFIGFDGDQEGIQVSICDRPLWIKQLATDRTILASAASIVHEVITAAKVPAIPVKPMPAKPTGRPASAKPAASARAPVSSRPQMTARSHVPTPPSSISGESTSSSIATSLTNVSASTPPPTDAAVVRALTRAGFNMNHDDDTSELLDGISNTHAAAATSVEALVSVRTQQQQPVDATLAQLPTDTSTVAEVPVIVASMDEVVLADDVAPTETPVAPTETPVEAAVAPAEEAAVVPPPADKPVKANKFLNKILRKKQAPKVATTIADTNIVTEDYPDDG